MAENGDRIRLKVMGLSYSQIRKGVYALILAQVGGPYRIPVVIGENEARSIAYRIEGVIPPRPITHDLFTNIMRAFGLKLENVFICKFEDGIFSSELTFSDGERTVTIDSRTSDAIAIAMRTGSPIFTTPEILNETGFLMDIGDTDGEEDTDIDEIDGGPDSSDETSVEDCTVEELEQTLNRLIEQEKYEEAAKINEILKNRKNNNNNNNNG